jgi:hypothetical protein
MSVAAYQVEIKIAIYKFYSGGLKHAVRPCETLADHTPRGMRIVREAVLGMQADEWGKSG